MNLVYKERKGTSYHNMSRKDQKLTLDISKFKIKMDSNRKLPNFDTEILTPELVGDQIEMMA